MGQAMGQADMSRLALILVLIALTGCAARQTFELEPYRNAIARELRR
jgi:hypothetical protein